MPGNHAYMSIEPAGQALLGLRAAPGGRGGRGDAITMGEETGCGRKGRRERVEA